MDRTWRRLVRKGVRFRRGYSAMPLCGPARASILTSRYPHNHGCATNMTHQPFVAQGHDQDTAATRMKEAGYDTGYDTEGARRSGRIRRLRRVSWQQQRLQRGR